jgi:hypothetical protein
MCRQYVFVLNKQNGSLKDWLTAGLIDIVLPPPLRISKYMWLMFYIIRILCSFYI